MLTPYYNHNRFKQSVTDFYRSDPHLMTLLQLKYQHSPDWWKSLSLKLPGIYWILQPM